jgi:nucleoid-associated protein YgaU
MSVMSAAEAGETPGTGQEILPRGPRTAASAAGQDGTGAEAGSGDERSARTDNAAPSRRDRRLRLISTEVRITEVRVAREISTRTIRTDARGAGVDGARVSVPRPRGPRVDLRPPWEPKVSERPRGGGADAERVAAPGGSVQRVRLQRASAQRVAACWSARVGSAATRPLTVRQASVQAGGLRLTRRGRRVLTGFVMLIAIVSAMLIWTSVAGGAQAPGPGAPARSVYQGMTQVVVQPGQTLWSIAIAADSSAAPWDVVQQIINANALNGAHIAAGQLLWVPRG